MARTGLRAPRQPRLRLRTLFRTLQMHPWFPIYPRRVVPMLLSATDRIPLKTRPLWGVLRFRLWVWRQSYNMLLPIACLACRCEMRVLPVTLNVPLDLGTPPTTLLNVLVVPRTPLPRAVTKVQQSQLLPVPSGAVRAVYVAHVRLCVLCTLRKMTAPTLLLKHLPQSATLGLVVMLNPLLWPENRRQQSRPVLHRVSMIPPVLAGSRASNPPLSGRRLVVIPRRPVSVSPILVLPRGLQQSILRRPFTRLLTPVSSRLEASVRSVGLARAAWWTKLLLQNRQCRSVLK